MSLYVTDKNGKLHKIAGVGYETVDATLNKESTNPVQNKVLYDPVSFAEAERQKSENIYEYLGDGAVNVGYGYVDSIERKWTPNKDFARTVFMVCKPNTTYRITKMSSARFVVASFNVTTTDLIPAASKTATVYITNGDEGQGVTYLKITTGTNDSRLGVFCVDARTDTNIEEILQSIEVTEFGEIVHKHTPSNTFAESERQKSKNLLTLRPFSTNRRGVSFVTAPENQTLIIDGTSTGVNEQSISTINPITLKANKTYTLSVKEISGTKHNDFYIYLYNSSLGLYTKVQGGKITNLVNTGVTFTLTEDLTFDALRQYSGAGTFENYVIQLQVEEGETKTTWQFPYGAIVHEKDLTNDLLYDQEIKNSIGGKTYTSGISNNIEVTSDFSQYKGLYVYVVHYGETQRVYLDLTKLPNGAGMTDHYCASYTGLTRNIDSYDSSVIIVNSSKTTLKGLFRYAFNSNWLVADTAYIYRIEGVK